MKKSERNEIIEKLTQIGKDVIQAVERSEIPKIEIPSRTTSNIVYDPEYLCYVIGDKKVKRSAGNIRHIRRLAQLLRVARFCKEEMQKSLRHTTKRELYYISESWEKGLKFDEQVESDNIIEDIEAMIGRPREDFRIIPNPRGSIYGDITLRYTTPKGDVKEVNCLDTPDGQAIGPRISEAEIIDCKADKVIAIETSGMYNRLMEEGAYHKFNAILVNLEGQASRATRRMIKRIHELLEIPVYIFTDGDPWGLHIAMVIMAGSAKSAHINRQLATPDAKWIGVTASDIKNYKLRSDKLKDVDYKRIKELSKDPRYKKDERLKKELELWKNLGKKAEQQALLRYGFEYVVEKYLPTKFKELG